MAISTHLVLVCCHGTYRGGDDPYDEANWILQSFQKSDPRAGKPGEHITFLQHINTGMVLMERDPQSLLVFSGGKTQNLVNTTEAESYIRAWRALNSHSSIHPRGLPETMATDSYQNLLFSIIRFRKTTGNYPSKITIITHAFKERRFLELHAPAIKFPAANIRVLGINPPFTLAELEQTQKGEQKNGFGPFATDLYGTRETLGAKRRARNWQAEMNEELASGVEEEVEILLECDGGEYGTTIFPTRLPWEVD